MRTNSLTQALSKALSQLLTAECALCGLDCNANYGLCLDCEAALPRMQTSCLQCGAEQADNAFIDGVCGNCLLNPLVFNLCRAAFHYASPVNKLITNFKFNAKFDAGYSLATILARDIRHHYANRQKPQLLIPVPLHRNRLRIRGFNQAVEIGKVISRQCNIPLGHSAIKKIRDTTPQIELSSALARKTNVSNAFAIADESLLKNTERVVVLDDVVTTMATVAAISKLLRQQGVQQVDVWCLARAGR